MTQKDSSADALAETQLDDLGPAVDPLVGKTIGERYRLLRKIGGGGMGAVYEAEHRVIGRRVAVKLLHAQFASDADIVRRFLNEARAASSIDHPAILSALDMGRTEDGLPFLVLELLRGVSLDRAIRDAGPLPIGRAVRIALQCASALEAAHAREIVHRDLKPENVFLLPGDHVKVLDFGISKLGAKVQAGQGTRTGAVLGTPYYMAPEQMRDASRVDARADVWALGVMLWEMLAGRVPFSGGSLPDLMLKVCTEPPPPLRELRPDVPEPLAAALDTALAKDPEQRFASMRALADAIAPFADRDEPARVSQPPAPSRPEPQPTPMSAETKIPVEPTEPATRARPGALAWIGGAVGLAAIAAVAIATTRAPEPSSATPARDLTPAPIPSELARPDPSPPRAETGAALDPPAPTITLTIASDAPAAEAEVRGVWRPLPYRAEIARGDRAEEILVRAPGRVAARRSIVLDRDLELSVPLARASSRAERVVAPAESAARETVETVAPPPSETPPAETPRPDPARPRASGVYTGPTGDIPDEI